MSKLICLLNNHNPVSASKCFKALDYHPAWTRKTYTDEEIFIGCLELSFKGQTDFWIETEDYVLAVDGEIFSWSEPLQEPSNAGKLLQLFLRYREDLVHHVNGNFTILVWDRSGKNLFVLNDRMGLRPLYFAAYNGKICLSSEMKAILADPDSTKKINQNALVDLFSYEYVLGNDTLIKGIETFPYASVARIHIQDIQLSPRRYWQFHYSPNIDKDITELSIRDLQNFNDLLLQAVKRTIKKNESVGLLLSGGLDSRMIACAIKETNVRHSNSFSIETFTFGESRSDDVRFARRVSKVIDGNHHYTGVQPKRLPEFFQRAVLYQDGMVSCNHCHYFHMLDELEQNVAIALDGFAGDVLPRQMFKPFLAGGFEAAYSVFDTIKTETRREILDRSLEAEVRQSKDRFYSFWQESLAVSPVNPLDHLNLTQRQRKFINYGKISKRNHVEVRLPFTDYDLMDYCLQMPRYFRVGDRICKEMIFKFCPRLGRIPQAEGGRLHSSRLQKRLYQKIDRMKSRLKWKKPLMDYSTYYRDFIKQFVMETLSAPELKSRGYINQMQVQKILNDHFQQKADHKIVIGILLTFELWCRSFLDGSPHA